MHALVALQFALEARERTGVSPVCEVAQLEVGACMTAEQVIAYSLAGKVVTRTGNRSETMAPQGVYPSIDGEWVALSVRDDGDWKRFITAIGSPEWAMADRFSTFERRHQYHDELDQLISEWSAGLNTAELVGTLHEAGIPVARVLSAESMLSDPHLRARKFYQELVHPISGPKQYAGWPMVYSVGPDRHHRTAPPMLGQHNSELLSEEAGLTGEQIEDLARKNVIGTVPRGLG
jgi:crotonobetainyl-CoA:carnitine CoA-transferase CaiB-like acyl-CoA transferase